MVAERKMLPIVSTIFFIIDTSWRISRVKPFGTRWASYFFFIDRVCIWLMNLILHRSTHSTSHRHLRCVATAALGVFYGLVDGKNKASSFAGRGKGVNFYDCWLPNASLHVVGDIFGQDINSVPTFSLMMLLSQFVENVGCVEAGVVAKLSNIGYWSKEK